MLFAIYTNPTSQPNVLPVTNTSRVSGRVLSPSEAQRQHEEIPLALGFGLFFPTFIQIVKFIGRGAAMC